MRIAIVGLPQSGKSTVLAALSGNAVPAEAGHRSDDSIATVRVPDPRVDRLSDMYKPKKTIYAKVEFVDPAEAVGSAAEKGLGDKLIQALRPADALLVLVKEFASPYDTAPPTPAADRTRIEEDLLLADLVVVEKRLSKMAEESKKGKSINQDERALLERCKECLDAGRPLRDDADLRSAQLLRGFTFMTSKPLLILRNVDESHASELRGEATVAAGIADTAISAKVEAEIAALAADDQAAFLSDLGISEPAMHRVIRAAYRLLGLISFFTVGEDEVRAWTIPAGTPARLAAGAIHSDIERGFIRAEVVTYEDLVSLGSLPAAQKAAKLRLEGKEYVVKDGEVVHFRFNV